MSDEALHPSSSGPAFDGRQRRPGLLERLREWLAYGGTIEPAHTPCRQHVPPGERLRDALDDAECLLRYASEAGIAVDDATAKVILRARFAGENAWSKEEASSLLASVAKLSALTRPVTGETLRACTHSARHAMRAYKRYAIILATIILPLSILSFIVTGLSKTITDNVRTSNDLAVKFVQSIGAGEPGNAARAPILETDLQHFAVLVRDLHGRAVQLSWLTPSLMERQDPWHGIGIETDAARRNAVTQLPVPLANPREVATEKVKTYQDIRSFAVAVQNDAELVYGAIGSVLLPVLYALLGCCAYLLRLFSDQVQKRTFAPTYANPARLLTAAIGGAVVGLFNNFTISQGASISPLATAFVVGYAVDVFFSFLDSLLLPLSRNRPTQEAQPAKSG